MKRALHDLIHVAADVCAESGATHTEVAERVLDMRRDLHRRWRRREIRQEEEYRGYEKDEERLRSLAEWLAGQDALPSEYEYLLDEESYSGPADAERDPQSVAAEEMTDYGVGAYGRPEPPSQPDINGATASSDFDPDRAIQEQQRRFRQKKRRAEKKSRQTIRFDTGPICLVMMADQHIGNAGTDIKRVFNEQETVLRTPGAYCWQLGDVVDNFIVEYLQEQNQKPSAPVYEQWELARHYFERWDDRIVGYVGGNHGAWTMQRTQLDYRRDICPDGILYDGDDIKATVSVGSATFDIWARHKWPGSSIYNPTHGAERAMRFNDPHHDIYVGAHTHEGAMCREIIYDAERKMAVQLGTYKLHDDHAREQGFPPSDGSTACALILHDDGSMHGMADLNAAKRYMQAVYS